MREEETLCNSPSLSSWYLLQAKKFEKYSTRKKKQFNKHLVSISYAPGTVLGTGGSEVFGVRTVPSESLQTRVEDRHVSQEMQFSMLDAMIDGENKAEHGLAIVNADCGFSSVSGRIIGTWQN